VKRRPNKTPAWKCSVIRKAVLLRDTLTDKALCARLNVGRRTIQKVAFEARCDV
jgi:hypothetical protein